MNTEDIRQLIGQEEGTELEYKSAKGGFQESFWDTFSTFANTHGGIIVFGIKEKDGRLIPDGLDNGQISKYKKNFWDSAHNKGKVSATMLAGWNDNHWPVPVLSERTQPDETMMVLQLANEKGMDNKHNVGENVGDGIWSELTDRQKLIIRELHKSPTISAKIMSERMSVSPRTIERDLQKLTALEAITHEGGDFGGEWKVLIKVPETV